MAIFAGNWFDPEGVPHIVGAAATQDGPQGSIARVSGQAPKRKLTPGQQRVRRDFGIVSRLYKEELTAAERLSWTAGNNTIVNRSRTTVDRFGHQRFVQVQMPLQTFAQALEDTQQQRKHYIVQDLDLLIAIADTQMITVFYNLAKQDATPHRSVMHVSQVPPFAVTNDSLWRYAIHIGSKELSTVIVTPGHSSESDDYVARYHFAVGDLLQVYVRITECENVNPPVTAQDSRETVEDWTLLTATAQ